MGCQFLAGCSLLLAFLSLSLGFARLALFHLAQFLGEVLLTHQSLLVVAGHLFAELLQLLADLACALLLSLSLANLTDGVLNLAVSLCQQLVSLLLGTLQDLLALTLNLFEVALIALDMAFERFLMLVDGLALTLPVSLVAHDVLQVLVALDIV